MSFAVIGIHAGGDLRYITFFRGTFSAAKTILEETPPALALPVLSALEAEFSGWRAVLIHNAPTREAAIEWRALLCRKHCATVRNPPADRFFHGIPDGSGGYETAPQWGDAGHLYALAAGGAYRYVTESHWGPKAFPQRLKAAAPPAVNWIAAVYGAVTVEYLGFGQDQYAAAAARGAICYQPVVPV